MIEVSRIFCFDSVLLVLISLEITWKANNFLTLNSSDPHSARFGEDVLCDGLGGRRGPGGWDWRGVRR